MSQGSNYNVAKCIFRGSLLKTCWSPTPTKRPSASEIVELLTNNPRLISPCIDVPLASVQIERTDSLELMPLSKKSPTHATIVGTLDPTDGKTILTHSKSSAKIESHRNGYYSPMHGNGSVKYQDRFMVSRSSSQAPDSSSGVETLTNGSSVRLTNESSGYYRPDSDMEMMTVGEPLLAGSHSDHQLTVGSYVQPGYIYVCDNY